MITITVIIILLLLQLLYLYMIGLSELLGAALFKSDKYVKQDLQREFKL